MVLPETSTEDTGQDETRKSVIITKYVHHIQRYQLKRFISKHKWLNHFKWNKYCLLLLYWWVLKQIQWRLLCRAHESDIYTYSQWWVSKQTINIRHYDMFKTYQTCKFSTGVDNKERQQQCSSYHIPYIPCIPVHLI